MCFSDIFEKYMFYFQPLYCVLPPRRLQKSAATLLSEFMPSCRWTMWEAKQPRSLWFWMNKASSEA